VNVLHDDAESRGACQRAIRSEEGRIVDACGGHIKCVVGADVMAALPGFSDQRGVRNAVDWPVVQIFEGLPRTPLFKLLA
jgi:hypothetical protein